MPSSSGSRRSHRRSGRRRSRRQTGGWLGKLFKWLAISGISLGILAAIGIGYLYYTIAPTLPDVQQLREVQL